MDASSAAAEACGRDAVVGSPQQRRRAVSRLDAADQRRCGPADWPRRPRPESLAGGRLAQPPRSRPDRCGSAWTPSADADLDAYSVHVGDHADFVPGNASLLTSGRNAACLDWGFKPGSTLYYKVIAFNKRGVASSPAPVRVEIPPMATATVELGIGEATLSGGLARTESRGVVSAFLPAPLGENAPHPTATWQFNVPVGRRLLCLGPLHHAGREAGVVVLDRLRWRESTAGHQLAAAVPLHADSAPGWRQAG